MNCFTVLQILTIQTNSCRTMFTWRGWKKNPATEHFLWNSSMQSLETQLLKPLAYLPSQNDFSTPPPKAQPFSFLYGATGDEPCTKGEVVPKNGLG